MSKAHLPFSFAKRHQVFVKEERDDAVVLAVAGKLSPTLLAELRRKLGKPLEFSPVPEEQFQLQLAVAYEAGAGAAQEALSGMEENLDLASLINEIPSPEDLLESQDDAPVIRLLNAVLSQALKQGASDVHFETFENHCDFRFRIDGVMHKTLEPPRALAPLLISRLKIMARLDIAEKRLPQDGRIALKIAGRNVDVRVSSIPTYYGERIVLRILDKQSTPLDLAKLGMEAHTLNVMRKLINQPNGIILVTGPTGSGKSTTLYAGLTELNEDSRNIMTVEDPIEYYIQGISQTQVNNKIEMTFARGLRAILRQDPDIIMVGEIRDIETANMAVQASLTGHLVLSTLHTNSAVGAVTRLRDMGVEPFLIASTVIGVIAQRLVRTLCKHCKAPHQTDDAEQKLMRLEKAVTVYDAKGCEHCGNTGYNGRTGIYELIPIDTKMESMIHNNTGETDMEAYARQHSPSIRQDGWLKVQAGVTTIAEVLRVTARD